MRGQHFDRLTVIRFDRNRTTSSGATHWICRCSCGALVSVARGSLKFSFLSNLPKTAEHPTFAEMMRQLFAIRISVGLGGDFVSTLLSSAHTAVTTSSSSAITPAELISLVKGVSNAAY